MVVKMYCEYCKVPVGFTKDIEKGLSKETIRYDYVVHNKYCPYNSYLAKYTAGWWRMESYQKIRIDICGGVLETVSKDGFQFRIYQSMGYDKGGKEIIERGIEFEAVKRWYNELGKMIKEIEDLKLVDKIWNSKNSNNLKIMRWIIPQGNYITD